MCTPRYIVNKNTLLRIINCYIDYTPRTVGHGRNAVLRLEARLPNGKNVKCITKEFAETSRRHWRGVHLCNLFEIKESRPEIKGQLRFRFCTS